ncbi:UxaA family hydrolase [Chitinophaga lutea]
MKKLMRIHPDDNVVIISAHVLPGDVEEFEGRRFIFGQKLGLGHKIAAADIPAGAKVIKFGVPIGTATADIPQGGHVHLHNIKSDFLSTYTHDHEFIQR